MLNKDSGLKVLSTIVKNSIAENSFNVCKACPVYETLLRNKLAGIKNIRP